MELVDAMNLADELMREHGLTEWTFKFDRALLRFGQCSPSRKIISLSQHLTKLNDVAEVRDTILHEIAHALCGPGHFHDYVWRRKAREIGAKPETCYDSKTVAAPKRNLLWTCQCGSVSVQRHRRPRATMWIKCDSCGNERGHSRIVVIPNERA